MPSHIETVLTSVGFSPEDATKIASLPEAEQAAFDAKPYAEKVKANYATQFSNDPEFFSSITIEKLPPAIKKQMESAQYARATNVAKGAIAKSLGFTPEQIKDLEVEDFKALDFYVPAIVDKWTKTKAGDKELQQQLIDARKQLEKYGPDFEKDVETKYETKAEERITGAIFNAALVGELAAIPGLKINAADIAKTAHEILSNKYAFERVGDYSVELRQKANPQMKVLKNNSSQELTLKDALLEVATERGWVEADDPTKKKQSGILTVEPKKGQLVMTTSPHIANKIAAKMATEK